jgi:hypothetical protein
MADGMRVAAIVAVVAAAISYLALSPRRRATARPAAPAAPAPVAADGPAPVPAYSD